MPLIQTDSKHYTDIANAIRAKNGLLTQYYPEDMAGAIGALPTYDNAIPDVYNHGNVVGLWPGYSNYYRTGQIYWSYSQTAIAAPYGGNGVFVFGGYFLKGNFKKICMEAEITQGTNGQYNTSGLYLVYCKDGYPTTQYGSGNKIISLTEYGNRTNYDHSSPWYLLPRQVCVADLTNITDEPFYLKLHSCDANPKIYSLWFE